MGMDFIVVIVVLAFFAIAAGYVIFCEKLGDPGDTSSAGPKRSTD